MSCNAEGDRMCEKNGLNVTSETPESMYYIMDATPETNECSALVAAPNNAAVPVTARSSIVDRARNTSRGLTAVIAPPVNEKITTSDIKTAVTTTASNEKEERRDKEVRAKEQPGVDDDFDV
ncbi:unnamed protein product [Nippostrongylus brasiliensis]|uniref:Eukaryotic translation initiation factor 4E-binding protein 1 n=1 Tax=Nippostrongylus brasiliensis TaxID=27835 RepID=A0A0N4YEZ2_NIPBR|nr:unnamed protein product [Nippostrongylus brasiliensis]